jgi:hypothetical protein
MSPPPQNPQSIFFLSFLREIRNKEATYTYIRKRQQKGPEVTMHTYP